MNSRSVLVCILLPGFALRSPAQSNPTYVQFRPGAVKGAHYFIRDSEIHYQVAASKDKDFIAIEGATHGGMPCTACETKPGQYSNTVKNFFDYVAKWINARF